MQRKVTELSATVSAQAETIAQLQACLGLVENAEFNTLTPETLPTLLPSIPFASSASSPGHSFGTSGVGLLAPIQGQMGMCLSDLVDDMPPLSGNNLYFT